MFVNGPLVAHINLVPSFYEPLCAINKISFSFHDAGGKNIPSELNNLNSQLDSSKPLHTDREIKAEEGNML